MEGAQGPPWYPTPEISTAHAYPVLCGQPRKYGLSVSQTVLLINPPQCRKLRNQPKGLNWSPNDQTIMRLSSSSLHLRALPLGTNFKHKRLFMVFWPQIPANFKGAIVSNIIPCATSHSVCPLCSFLLLLFS